MCARGLSQLRQPLLLQQNLYIHVEWHRPRDELEGNLASFYSAWLAGADCLAVIEGIGSGMLRATAVSNKKEFCLVTGVYWALEGTERRRYTTFCHLCQ